VDPRWRFELLGGLRATCPPERLVTRFRTRKTGALLAYLALYPHRLHPRAALVDSFWPEYDPRSGRQSLRQALSSLRQQFEERRAPAPKPMPCLFVTEGDAARRG
jgi:DNA-binding SARP family transcriptional activator